MFVVVIDYFCKMIYYSVVFDCLVLYKIVYLRINLGLLYIYLWVGWNFINYFFGVDLLEFDVFILCIVICCYNIIFLRILCKCLCIF